MDNEKRQNEIDEAASSLIANAEETTGYKSINAQKTAQTEEKTDGKIFQKFKIKDIVFLAIMAACMLVTGAVMPIVGSIPVFAIVQVCLGLQFSVFPTIGMMKVRKPGALLFMSLCCGALFAFMFFPMFICIMICALVAEGLTLLIFRGYKKDGACLFAGAIYFPITLPIVSPLTTWWYSITGKDAGSIVFAGVMNPWVAIGMSAAVVVICIIGAIVGVLISRELKKAGVLKK